MDVGYYQNLEALSPFEIKDELIRLAKGISEKSAKALLNAGRGNPNWIATTPRDGFFLLGQFAMSESRRVLDMPQGVGGMARQRGIAQRAEAWLQDHDELPGAGFLADALAFAVSKFGFDADEFVHELVDSIIGDNYPVPDRILKHNEIVSHAYLKWAMGGDPWPDGRFDLFAVEGGTAAMCYLFKTLKFNRLLLPGDTIALGTPIFTPYLEMPHLEDYGLSIVYVNAPQSNRFQYTDEELKKLEDPKIKAFFLVNPGNPSSVAIDPETMKKIVDLVTNRRPDLILLTDDVYGTFVPGFRSLLAELPHNTIGVYSYSKYFGCTGWRLGLIAVHQDNVFDQMIARHSDDVKEALDKRYGALTLKPRGIKFIDRVVADSRDVALNHTAGLSLPQQVMMTLFGLCELMDVDKAYQTVCMEIVHRRFRALVEGLGIEVEPGKFYDAYYGLIDFDYWLTKYVGPEVATYVRENVHPLDIVFKLAESHGIVLLNGGGFQAPNWSARVSFANLDDDVYDDIGRAVRAVARGYVQTYNAAKNNPPMSTQPLPSSPR